MFNVYALPGIIAASIAKEAAASPQPLTYRAWGRKNGPFSSFETGAKAIGAASYNRWVIFGVYHNYNSARSLESLTMNGIKATLLYAAPNPLTVSGARLEFWKAHVPFGTTVNVSGWSVNSIWDHTWGIWTAEAEPMFYAGAFDNTFSGTSFSLNVDIPEGGAVIAMSNNAQAGTVISSLSGVDLDFNDDFYRIMGGHDDLMSAEIGRPIDITWNSASTVTGFYGLGAASLEFSPSPDEVLHFSGWNRQTPGNPLTVSVNIGLPHPDRWVIVGLLCNFDTGRVVDSVTINGVPAVQMYAAPTLTTAGSRYEYWKAPVSTGEIVNVVATANGSFYGLAVGAWISLIEPLLYDSEFDAEGGGSFTVNLDVTEGGAVIAMANTTFGSVTSAVGVTQDFWNSTDVNFGGHDTRLPFEINRTVSVVYGGGASGTVWDGLAAISVEFVETPTLSNATVESTNRIVQNTSGTTSGVVTSGSPAAGRLVILHMAYGDNIAGGTPFVWPAGFTQGGRDDSGWANSAWAWKEAGDSEPSDYTVTWSTGNTRSILTCVVVDNHNGIAGSALAFTSSNTNNVIAPAFSSTPRNSLRLNFFSFGWGGGTMTNTPPTLDPPLEVLHAPVFTSGGDNNDGCGAFSQYRVENGWSYGEYTNLISWTLNGSGVTNARLTIAIASL